MSKVMPEMAVWEDLMRAMAAADPNAAMSRLIDKHVGESYYDDLVEKARVMLATRRALEDERAQNAPRPT